MVFHFQHHRAVSELCDCRYLCSTAWFSGISLSWGQVSRRNPAFRIPYVSILLSSRQKVIPKTNSEGCLFFFVQPELQQRVWVVCVCLLSVSDTGQRSLQAVFLSPAAVDPQSGQRILSAVMPQLLSDSVSSRLLVLNGLERMEVGGGGRNICNFDTAAVVELGFYALCLRQAMVPFCKFSDAKRNTQKTHLSYCKCKML